MAIPSAEFARLMSEALDDFNAGRFPQAEAACHRLLQRDAHNPAVHQLLAVVLFQRRDIRAAQHHIMQSLAQRPDHVAALTIAGKIARAGGELTTAVLHFERAVSFAPDAAEPAFLLGSTLADLRRPVAIATLQRMLLRHPGHAEGWCALGIALKKDGKQQAALSALDRAIECNPNMVQAHFHRANVLQEQGQLDGAVRAYQYAFQLDPGSMEVAFNLGVALHAAGLPDAARAMLENSVALAPSFADAWFSLGLVRQDLHDLTGAAVAFRTALVHRPDYAEAAVNLGIALQESGAMNDATVLL